VNITTGAHPVRYLVVDNFVQPQGDWTVPPADAPGAWEAIYSNDCESLKRTSRTLPDWAAQVITLMHAEEILRACAKLSGTPAYPEPLLWGGGLQVMSPDGWLNCHLDGVILPSNPALRRAVQLVCFAHLRWESDWGGEFAFFHPSGAVALAIEPLPGRLVAFENTDLACHGVLPIQTHAAERVSLSSSLVAASRASDTRERAWFLPNRGAPKTPLETGKAEKVAVSLRRVAPDCPQ